MAHLLQNADFATEREVASVPAKMWRNCFHSWGHNIFPSEADARVAGESMMQSERGLWARLYEVTYRGAFPVTGE